MFLHAWWHGSAWYALVWFRGSLSNSCFSFFSFFSFLSLFYYHEDATVSITVVCTDYGLRITVYSRLPHNRGSPRVVVLSGALSSW